MMTRTIPSILLLLAISTSVTDAEDWPMFGRDATRNAVSPEKNAPTDWDVGEFDRKTGRWVKAKARNIKWTAQLGSQTMGDPVVAGGLVWVGTNNYWKNLKQDASVLALLGLAGGQFRLEDFELLGSGDLAGIECVLEALGPCGDVRDLRIDRPLVVTQGRELFLGLGPAADHVQILVQIGL